MEGYKSMTFTKYFFIEFIKIIGGMYMAVFEAVILLPLCVSFFPGSPKK